MLLHRYLQTPGEQRKRAGYFSHDGIFADTAGNPAIKGTRATCLYREAFARIFAKKDVIPSDPTSQATAGILSPGGPMRAQFHYSSSPL